MKKHRSLSMLIRDAIGAAIVFAIPVVLNFIQYGLGQ